MTASDVRIPPDWLRTPNYAKRSELLDARKHERKQLALDLGARTNVAYFERDFARSETIFRDSFRHSGAFEALSVIPKGETQPANFHARATCSGLPTRSAYLAQRQQDKHVASLKLEPPEIERLKDIPKTPQLRRWWTLREGYVVDPTPMIENSFRLELARHGVGLGPLDPGKVRCTASVDERRMLKERKAQLALKVNRITHGVDSESDDKQPMAILHRADDLYAQPRRQQDSPGAVGGGGVGGGGGSLSLSSSSSSMALPTSPIKVDMAAKRARRLKQQGVENLFLESTNQRMMLDHIKACPPLSPSDSVPSMAWTTQAGGGRPRSEDEHRDRATASGAFSPMTFHHRAARPPNDFIRCGGFA